MPVSDFISRASNLVSKVLENQSSQKSGKSVDDIVFYRSNACIHLPLNIGNCSDHNRGYMIIRKRSDKVGFWIGLTGIARLAFACNIHITTSYSYQQHLFIIIIIIIIIIITINIIIF